MKVFSRVVAAAPLLLISASGVAAQQGGGTDEPIPAGTYVVIEAESPDITAAAEEAVSHMNFLIRGIAKRRLMGANERIDRIDVRYSADSVFISLREDEPPVKSLRSGEYIPYTRPDGEVVQVKTQLAPGVIDQSFRSDDGEKQMIYRLRPDGRLELVTTVFSDKLQEPFTYTWVYEPR